MTLYSPPAGASGREAAWSAAARRRFGSTVERFWQQTTSLESLVERRCRESGDLSPHSKGSGVWGRAEANPAATCGADATERHSADWGRTGCAMGRRERKLCSVGETAPALSLCWLQRRGGCLGQCV